MRKKREREREKQKETKKESLTERKREREWLNEMKLSRFPLTRLFHSKV